MRKIDILEDLLTRGVREGVFRDGVDLLHLNLLIASFSFYRVSNRHRWRVIFGRDLSVSDDAVLQRQKRVACGAAVSGPVSRLKLSFSGDGICVVARCLRHEGSTSEN
jgi:hypothetical protein